MLFKNKTIIMLVILFSIFLFHLINNYIVLSKDVKPICFTAHSICHTINLYHQFIIGNDFKTLYRLYATWPFYPLFMVSTVLGYLLLGLSPGSAVMTNMLYFLILLFSVYNIGKIMYNRNIGIFSSFLVSFLPGVIGFSRIFSFDFSLTAIVSLSLYLYLSTDKFRSFRNSLFFGISIGLGFLTKMSYPLFLSVPIIHFFISDYIKDEMAPWRKKALVNLAFSFMIGLLIASTYYLPNLHFVLEMAKALSFEEKFMAYNKNILQGLRDWLLFKPFFIISAIAFFTYLRRKELFLILVIIVPIFIFSLSSNVNPRYLLPILPGISIILSAEIFSLGRYKTIILPFIILFSLTQFFLLSYIPNEKLFFMKNDIMHTRTYQPLHVGLFIAQETKKDYGSKILMDILITNSKELNNVEAKILFAFLDNMLLSGDLLYDITLRRLKFNVLLPYVTTAYYFKKNFKPFYSNLDSIFRNVDFVIWKNGGDIGIGEVLYDGFDIIKEMSQTFTKLRYEFEICGKFYWPDDGTEILVYKNKKKNK